jgi:hypothetical protein
MPGNTRGGGALAGRAAGSLAGSSACPGSRSANSTRHPAALASSANKDRLRMSVFLQGGKEIIPMPRQKESESSMKKSG